MKADWIIRIELSRFFENHAELRARVKVGKFKDQIHRGVFASTLVEVIEAADIQRGLKVGYIGRDRVREESGAIRNIFVWLDQECEYQPVAYKRWFQKGKEWLQTKFLTNY